MPAVLTMDSAATINSAIPELQAGNIVTIVGPLQGQVADTICHANFGTVPLPSIPVDPPTISMLMGANTSPLAGREGKKLLARQIRDRLLDEVRVACT
jgi:GTP-binding protein